MLKKVALIMCLVLMMTGCMPSQISKNDVNSSNRAMVARSLINTGNTSRINEIVKKAKDGQQITIAFMSSSAFIEDIKHDEDSSTVQITVDKLKELLGSKTDIKTVKLCIGGSTSKLGEILLSSEVLNNNPDIIIIDYAVFDKHEQEEREAFETIIRNSLQQKNEPQVLIFLNSKSDSNSKQDFMEQIARYYNLPIINMANAIFPEISSGRTKQEEFFIDTLNYTEKGKKIIASYIVNYVSSALKIRDNDYILPIPMYPNSVSSDIKLIDAEDIDSDNDGSFVREKNDNEFFKKTIKYLKNTQNMPFEFTLAANDIYLVVPTSKFRSDVAEIYIDGEKKLEINTNGDTLFDAPQPFKIYSSNSAEPVKIGIKLKESVEQSDENNKDEQDSLIFVPKKDFEFWGIAYNIKKQDK